MTPRIIVPTRGTILVEVTQNDSATVFEFQLLDVHEQPQSLDGVQSVTFTMKRKIDGAYIMRDVECTITNSATGEGTVRPVLTSRGTFIAQFRVTFADGSTLSFPNGWDVIVKVRKAA